jgi:LacI family transcriptional regulator
MPGLRRSTLADVARRAGVSRTTASYILNGRSAQMRISTATERRVQQAMRELDYRPNWSARTLRRSRTQTIGFVSDFVAGGGFAGELLNGASAAARACDHLLVIGETLGHADTERLLVEEMVERQVDGIIYATVSAREVALPERLRRGGRLLTLNCVDPAYRGPAVLPDDEGGGRQAAAYLLAHASPGPIVVVGDDADPQATAGRERLLGLVDVLAAGGREVAQRLSSAWDVLAARNVVEAWLSRGGRPGTLVCMNDRIAMGAYQALANRGLEIGTDVSVISFDGSELATWLRPALTSLALPLRDMGERAVQVLMSSQWRGAGTVRLPLVLREGASMTGAATRSGR